jgi:membrane glycosyltransferase
MKPGVLLEKITAETVGFRRASFFGAILASTGLGVWFLARAFSREGFSALEVAQLILFAFLLHQIVTGFWLAVLGGWTQFFPGKEIRMGWTGPVHPAATPPVRTALVLPMYNEDSGPIFAMAETLWNDLQATGRGDEFDIFFLSDSNRPENWIAEEWGWFDLCRRTGGWSRIHYRKRRSPRHGKSGNLADFCRRWGAHYRYMVTLDADSIMTAGLITRLVSMMESAPRVGIIQTLPYQIFGRTLFRRIQQFSVRLYAPVFAAGANYWHLFAGNFWGHNAILRVAPFIQFCDLPELPEPSTDRRHILSHDTIEAALMRKAGYDVWLAYGEEGSYETAPPNLADHMVRERRWCRGNLQHFWFLFAPGIDFANRFHIWTGLMAYLAAPLWLAFLVCGAFDSFFKHHLSLLSSGVGGMASSTGRAYSILFFATLGLLLLPKLIGLWSARRRMNQMGGWLRTMGSVACETLAWSAWAPSMMLYNSLFVMEELLGKQVGWAPQNRTEAQAPSLFFMLRRFWLPVAAAVLAGFLITKYIPHQMGILLPILIAWLATPWLAWLTAQPDAGEWARRIGLFLVPEEIESHLNREIRGYLHRVDQAGRGSISRKSEITRLVRDPALNALHISLLRVRRMVSEKTRQHLVPLREKALEKNPAGLSQAEWMDLLTDPDSCLWLHRQFWKRPTGRIHSWWREGERPAVS